MSLLRGSLKVKYENEDNNHTISVYNRDDVKLIKAPRIKKENEETEIIEE